MALLDNLFSKKPPAKTANREEADRGAADSQPSVSSQGGHAADRKNLRLERRELLYAVVRESMTRVGMLSSSYKFKVLSLDPRGRQYLIMMDLAQESGIETSRMAEIESIIAQSAKARHDIVVKALYWRLDGTAVGAESRQPRSTPEAAASQALQEAHVPGQIDPIQAELAAFKQAQGRGKPAAAASEKPIKSWRRNPASHTDFADTQIQEQPEDHTKPAGRTTDFLDTDAAELAKERSSQGGKQYGDLS